MADSNFKKFLIELRDERDESLRDMASNLDITAQFLSALENGKKHIGSNVINKIINRYKLNKDQIIKLETSVISSNDIKFNIKGLNKNTVNFLAILFKKYEGLSDKKIEKLMKVLKEN